jgi:TatD DNase family protein
VGWTDSHCHVSYDGVGLVAVERAVAAGVTRVVTIGTDVGRSREAIDAVRAGRASGLQLWATAGVHPHEAVQGIVGLAALLDEPEVVAVGECGLDYYYEHSPREAQLEVFAAQVTLAHERGLALVVHTRDAWADTLAVLDEVGVPPRTVIHCFSGGPDEARACLDRGAVLSFSGIVTFKNATGVREAAQLCPLDRLLVETDAPYLAPVPHRGRPNEPAWVAIVGTAVAAVRSVDPVVVERATWATAEQVFDLA